MGNDERETAVGRGRLLPFALVVICLSFASLRATEAIGTVEGDGDEVAASPRITSASVGLEDSARGGRRSGNTSARVRDDGEKRTKVEEAMAASRSKSKQRTSEKKNVTEVAKKDAPRAAEVELTTKKSGKGREVIAMDGAVVSNPQARKKKIMWETRAAFGQRKIVKEYAGLRDYLEEERGVTEEEGDSGAGREGGGGGGENEQVATLPLVQMYHMEMSEQERSWLNVREVFWKDLSGKLIEQEVSRCAACADDTLFRRAMLDDEVCGNGSLEEQPRLFSHCYGHRTDLQECEKLRQKLQSKLDRTGGERGPGFPHEVFNPSTPRSPYVARFRNAYVSKNGLIYNEDMVFDPRGGCSRGIDDVIRPDVAKTRRRFKKVYVADHVYPGIHHEFAEMAAQLMGYYREIMEDESIMIHTTGFPIPPPGVEKEEGGWWPNQSARDLIDYLGVKGSRLVAGDVYADEVIVTEMHCWFMQWTFRIYGTRLGRLLRAVASQKRLLNAGQGGGENNSTANAEPSSSCSGDCGGGDGGGIVGQGGGEENGQGRLVKNSTTSADRNSTIGGGGGMIGEGGGDKNRQGGLEKHSTMGTDSTSGNSTSGGGGFIGEGGGEKNKQGTLAKNGTVSTDPKSGNSTSDGGDDGNSRNSSNSRAIVPRIEGTDNDILNLLNGSFRPDTERMLVSSIAQEMTITSDSSGGKAGVSVSVEMDKYGVRRLMAAAMAVEEELDPDLFPPLGKGTILVIKRSWRRRIENHDELIDALNKLLDEEEKEKERGGSVGEGSTDHHVATDGGSEGKSSSSTAAPSSSSSLSSLPSASSSSSSSSSGQRRIVEVYDDRLVKDLGEIWSLFMRADLVLGPHGAGLTNILASRMGTAVYEFVVPFGLSWDNSRFCLCFRDMSSMLGLHYYTDFPTEVSEDTYEFDEESRSWVQRPLGMIVDVTKTIANVRLIFKERGWKFR